MFCKHCGKEIKSDSRFCSNCGISIDDGVVMKTEKYDMKAKAASKKTVRICIIVTAILLIILVALNNKDDKEETKVNNEPASEIISEPENLGEIVLTDGLMGEYGEIEKIDSFEYINYHIPIGKYKVVANTSRAIIYLDEDEYITNSDGYSEAINIVTLKFSEIGEEKELEVVEDSHIALVEGTKVTLIPID